MKKLPWFRAYTEMVDDEKLRLLAFEDRWHFVALLCLKGQGVIDEGGTLLLRKVAVKLGIDTRTLDEVIRRLAEVGLIDEKTLQPIAWENRQFSSDSSAERVAAYRERKKQTEKRNCNVTVTTQDTDTDTEEGKPSAPASPEADSFPADASLKTETPAKPKTSAVEFKTFLAACTDAGKPAIPEDDPIFTFAEEAGIPIDLLGLAWAEFRRRYNGSSKRYRDWRQVFRNAVRDNWFKLWFCNENGQVCLSTQGRLIQKTHGVTA